MHLCMYVELYVSACMCLYVEGYLDWGLDGLWMFVCCARAPLHKEGAPHRLVTNWIFLV